MHRRKIWIPDFHFELGNQSINRNLSFTLSRDRFEAEILPSQFSSIQFKYGGIGFSVSSKPSSPKATKTSLPSRCHPIDGFSAGLIDESNVFEWNVTIMGPPDTLYSEGYFDAVMTFPYDYPVNPPSVRFVSEMWHPNVYADGKVCISILHPPGNDPNGYELASERWSPVHTVESIVLSIISMLSSPNDESPANVDAAVEWRERKDEFKEEVGRCVRKSSLDYEI